MWRALLLAGLFPVSGLAGPIAHEYAQGFDGVAWGDSLAELVAKHPGGEHFFAVGEGHRDYSVANDTPLFGIRRPNMRIYYFLDDTGSVISASIQFPYQERAKLMGALTLSFGPYRSTFTRGISTHYQWPRDDGTSLSVEATLDPAFGMLRLSIFGPNSLLDQKREASCDGPKAPAAKPN